MLGGMGGTLSGMPVPPGGMHAVLPVTQAGPPSVEAVLVGLAALAVVIVPFLGALAANLDTMAHEGTHALAASIMGFTLLGVTMDLDSAGATSYYGRGTLPRLLLTGFVGYLGPSAFGLFAAKLIETGHAIAVLWIAIILLTLLLFLVRKSFGLVSVPVAIALLALVVRYGHDGLEGVIAYGMTWLLLLSGFRTAMNHGAGAGDAVTLSSMTSLPRQIWALLWIAGALLAVIIGGKWLVLHS